MKYCVFDTETTGLPLRKSYYEYYSPKDFGFYENARVIQLAWLIFEINENDEIINENRYNYYLNYDKEITNSHIHRIDLNLLEKVGNDRNIVIHKFLETIKDVDMLVAHNISFDLHVLQSEIERLNIPFNLFDKKSFCTMEQGKNITKIKGNFTSYKCPKLVELYSFYYPDEDELLKNAHDASVDVEMCFKCFQKIRNFKNCL